MEKLDLPIDESGYSVSDAAAAWLHQPLDGGRGRVRADMVDGVARRIPAQWTVRREGYDKLRAFYKRYVGRNAEQFLVDLITDTAALEEHKAIFIPNSFRTTQINGLTFLVTAELEVEPNDHDDYWPGSPDAFVVSQLDFHDTKSVRAAVYGINEYVDVTEDYKGVLWKLWSNAKGYASINLEKANALWFPGYQLEGGFSSWDFQSEDRPEFVFEGDFTIELRHTSYRNAGYTGVWPFFTTSQNPNGISEVGTYTFALINGLPVFAFKFGPAGIDFASAETVNPAYHINFGTFDWCVERYEGLCRIYRNGEVIATQLDDWRRGNHRLEGPLSLGTTSAGGHLLPNNYLEGEYRNWRVTNGVARYKGQPYTPLSRFPRP